MQQHPGTDAVSVGAILRLALPSSAVFLLSTVLALLMIRFASALGADAVVAVNAGTRLYNVFLAMAAGLNAGTLALVANAWGAGDRDEASRYLQLSLLLSTLLGGLLTIAILVFAPAIIGIFDLHPLAHAESVAYARWQALFFVPMAQCLVLVTGVRGSGDVRTPMALSLLINGLWLWLSWRWTRDAPFAFSPHVRFIAIGMGFGHLAGAALGYALWRSRRLTLVPVASDGRTRQRLAQLWTLGYPAALEQGVLQVGVLAFLGIVGRYGSAAFAAYGTGISLLSLAMVIGFGFSVAVAVLVGQQLGAGSPANARLVALRALKVTIAVLSVPGIVLALNARAVALWLTGDADIAAHTVTLIYAFTLTLPLLGVEFCLGGALRGAGDTRFPLLNVIAGLLVVRFGLAWLFATAGLPVGWIYATIVADYAVKNVLLIRRFRSNRWMTKTPRQPVADDLRGQDPA
jgi:putative MATE family efflux protein